MSYYLVAAFGIYVGVKIDFQKLECLSIYEPIFYALMTSLTAVEICAFGAYNYICDWFLLTGHDWFSIFYYKGFLHVYGVAKTGISRTIS